MRLQGTLLATAVLAFVAMPAMAALTPDEPWDSSVPGDEVNLYEIYRDIWGASVGSNADMDVYQIENDPGVLDLGSMPMVVSVTVGVDAQFAWLISNIGYYEINDDGSIAQNLLFSGISVNGYVAPGTYTATIAPDDPFGLFMYGHVPGDPTVGYTWYSEASRNLNQEDHFLVYATSDPSTLFVAWEDMPWINPWPAEGDDPNELNSDRDYNDVIMRVRLNETIVPEPGSMLLLGMGVAGMAVRRFLKS